MRGNPSPLKIFEGFRRAGRILGLSLLLGGLGLACPESPRAYLMTSEQLIKLMTANFSKYQTVTIEQVTLQEGGDDGSAQEQFQEVVSMKSPDLFRARIVGPGVAGRACPADLSYRRLIVANTLKGMTDFLSGKGIDLDKVAFTRIDGTIAYRIGDKDPASPRILIEKERFLPLLLAYRSKTSTDWDMIAIRFRDYRQLEQGWFPFEILCSCGEAGEETSRVRTLQANVPIDPSIFSSPQGVPPSADETEGGLGHSDEERLRRVIRKFEEKYGQ